MQEIAELGSRPKSIATRDRNQVHATINVGLDEVIDDALGIDAGGKGFRDVCDLERGGRGKQQGLGDLHRQVEQPDTVRLINVVIVALSQGNVPTTSALRRSLRTARPSDRPH